MKSKKQRFSHRVSWSWILLGLAVGVTGCGTAPTASNTNAKTSVAVETVQEQVIAQKITVNGAITPYLQTFLSAATTGQLAAVLVRPGQIVHVGEVVAKLDASQNVPQENALSQAQASVQTAQTSYQNAQALYGDRTTSESQVVAAQNALNEAKAGVQVAQANLLKAQLQEQAALSGGPTQQDGVALQNIVNADQQALQATQSSLSVALQNETLLKQQLDNDQQQFGSITELQVQQAYQNYQTALSRYDSWQQNTPTGQNPYTSQLSATQAIYQGYSSGFNSLQQAQEQVNQAIQASNQAQSQVSAADSALAVAQKNQADANPSYGSNAAQQAETLVSVAQASLNQAQSQYLAGQKSLAMAQQIYNDRTQAQVQVDTANAALQQALVNQNGAKATLNLQIQNDMIVSPISGTVVATNAQAGQSVSPQMPILTIATQSPTLATLNVPESQINYFHAGTNVSLALPAMSKTLPGRVIDIRPQTDPSTNEYQVDVEVNGPSPAVLAGLQVQGTVALSSTMQAIYVPAQSVLTLNSGGNKVFVIQNGVAHSRLVEVGSMTATQYEITRGLQPGDVLVVAGQNYLSDGDKVQIAPSSSGNAKAEGTHS